jgi:hypothetical protein
MHQKFNKDLEILAIRSLLDSPEPVRKYLQESLNPNLLGFPTVHYIYLNISKSSLLPTTSTLSTVSGINGDHIDLIKSQDPLKTITDAEILLENLKYYHSIRKLIDLSVSISSKITSISEDKKLDMEEVEKEIDNVHDSIISIAKPNDVKKIECRDKYNKQIWIAKGVIELGRITFISGPPGSSKSNIVKYILESFYTGKKEISGIAAPLSEKDYVLPYKGTEFLVLSEEDINLLQQHYGGILGIRDHLFLWKEEFQSFDNKKFIPLLRNLLQRNPQIKIIVVDTLYNIAGSLDINKAENIGKILKPLEQIAIEFNLAIIITHHTNKSKPGSALDAISGSGQVRAKARYIICVDQLPDREFVGPDKNYSLFILQGKKNSYGTYEPKTLFYLISKESSVTVSNSITKLDEEETVSMGYPVFIEAEESDDVDNCYKPGNKYRKEDDKKENTLNLCKTRILSCLQQENEQSSTKLYTKVGGDKLIFNRAREELVVECRITTTKVGNSLICKINQELSC